MKTTLTIFFMLIVFVVNSVAHAGDPDKGRKQIEVLKKEFVKKGWLTSKC